MEPRRCYVVEIWSGGMPFLVVTDWEPGSKSAERSALEAMVRMGRTSASVTWTRDGIVADGALVVPAPYPGKAQEVSDGLRRAAASLGSRGGRAGRGEAKRRAVTPEAAAKAGRSSRVPRGWKLEPTGEGAPPLYRHFEDDVWAIQRREAGGWQIRAQAKSRIIRVLPKGMRQMAMEVCDRENGRQGS